MLQRFAPLAGKRALDIGCGVGVYVARMAELGRAAYGVDVDEGKVRRAGEVGLSVCVGEAEHLPFASDTFDVVLLHEVIEHVRDDRRAVEEACRVTNLGGRIVIFAPNRLYPFETHGAYWRGIYHFGNIPLVNYLPDAWRERFCPHVRVYTRAGLRALYEGLPCRPIVYTQIYPGYDKVARRSPLLASLFRRVTYLLEHTPLRALGLSHFLVLEKADKWSR